MFTRSIPELRKFLDRATLGFSLQRTEWRNAPSWQLKDGFLSHVSGGFFSVVGVEFPEDVRRNGVFLYQPQSAITGLLTTRLDGECYALLQARAEPGACGIAQFGPTIQSTPANYQALHGGQSTPYFEYFSTALHAVCPYGDTTQLDLGERYWMKSKRSILAQCRPDIPLATNYVWASVSALQQGVLHDAFFNVDLRSLLAVMPWDSDGFSPRSAEVCRGLAEAVRAQVIGGLLARIKGKPGRARLMALGQLENWRFSEAGMVEIEKRQGFELGFFTVTAPEREMPRWTQPLLLAATEGRAVLLCRRHESGLQVLVRVADETGLQSGSALLPSYLRYPGSLAETTLPELRWESMPLIAATLESDEGGRFHQHLSRYELRWCDEQDPCHDGVYSAWINLAELKALLQLSNCCSIQLRGLASLLLGCTFPPALAQAGRATPLNSSCRQ